MPLPSPTDLPERSAARRALLRERLALAPEESVAGSAAELLPDPSLDRGDGVLGMRVAVGSPGGGGHPAEGGIPALLLRPAPERDTGAGVVLVAGHGPGVVGLVDREDGYHHGLPHDLAAAGVTVLCPEMISFGSRRTGPVGPPEESSCRVDAARFGLHGRPVLGRRVADAAAAVAALRGQPGVDPARVAVAGGSGGGAVALMLAAADEEVAGALVATYLSSFAASIAALPHCPCNIVPGLLPELEMADIAALIAPRLLIVEAGERDPIFPLAATRDTVERITAAWADAPGALRLIVTGADHHFTGRDSLTALVTALD